MYIDYIQLHMSDYILYIYQAPQQQLSVLSYDIPAAHHQYRLLHCLNSAPSVFCITYLQAMP